MIAAILFFISATAHADIVGRVAMIQGDATVESKVLGHSTSLRWGMDISEGDTLFIGATGKAKIYSEDEIEINLMSGSQLRCVHYESSPSRRDAQFEVAQGRVRFISHVKFQDFEVSPGAMSKRKATVLSESADFFIDQNPKENRTKFVSFNGIVHAGAGSLSGGQSLEIRGAHDSGTATEIDKNELTLMDRNTKLDVMPPPKDLPKPAATQGPHRKRKFQN